MCYFADVTSERVDLLSGSQHVLPITDADHVRHAKIRIEAPLVGVRHCRLADDQMLDAVVNYAAPALLA